MNKVLLYFINYCRERSFGPDEVGEALLEDQVVSDAYFQGLDLLQKGMIPTIAGNVYTLPIIEEFQADNILAAAKGYDYTPNEDEDKEYQIEEAVLSEKDPVMYRALINKLLPTLNAWCLMTQHSTITKVESFQIAKYCPEGVAATGWHHDEVSDFTCVISLNPDEFEGGGTGVRTSPHDWLVLPPLKKGWGMVFDGRSVHHRGLPVTKGVRYLLVCWCSTEEVE